MNIFHLSARVVLLVLLAAVPAGAGLAAADSQLHVVLACDDAHPQLGEGFAVNEWAVRSTLVQEVASIRLKLLNPDRWRKGGAPPLTRKLLLEYLAALPVQPDDALIVYLACERGQTTDGNERFRFSGDKPDDVNGWFTREEILVVLKKKNVRLAGLITDGGSAYTGLDIPHYAISTVMPPVTETSLLCEKLFFKSNGLLNVASAAPGEQARYYDNYAALDEVPKQDRRKKLVAAQAMGENVGDDHDLRYGFIRLADNPLQGGYFTESLVTTLQDWKLQPLTWEQMLSATDTEMKDQLRALPGQPQTVQLLTMPGSVDQGTSSGGDNSDGTLHLIVACDVDDPDLGEGFEINEGLLRWQFIDSVATRKLRIYSPWISKGVDAPELTVKNLLGEIDKVRLKPNDTLMVYLACHGSWDKSVSDQWFRFENDGGSALYRKTLIQRIKAKNTQLGLLITDACANYDKLPTRRLAVSPPYPPLEKTAPLYQALFFDQQGFLDLSSSSPGQFTLYYNNYKDWKAGDKLDIRKSQFSREIPGGGMLDAYSMQLNGVTMKGGLFTESMASLLKTNIDRKYDWKQFTKLLRDDVENRFDEENPDGQLKTGAGTLFQDGQTVAVGEFPQPLGEPGTQTGPQPGSGPATDKFGVSVVASRDGGVKITSVRDDGPAARYGMSAGEVIQKINNQPVNTPDDLEAALASAPATFRVTVGGESFIVRP